MLLSFLFAIRRKQLLQSDATYFAPMAPECLRELGHIRQRAFDAELIWSIVTSLYLLLQSLA
jgi:hypothetical protein